MQADPEAELHVVDAVTSEGRQKMRAAQEHVGLGVRPHPGNGVPNPSGITQHLLAEVKEQLLKDEDGAGAAEDDERLPSKEAKHGTCHCCAKEALHDTLGTD